MDLFELLFIALFILFPILEQVLKRKKGSGPGEPGPDPMETEEGEISPRSQDRKPVKAADMVPDDLWAVLTGEQRPPSQTGGSRAPEGVGSTGETKTAEGVGTQEAPGESEVPWWSEAEESAETVPAPEEAPRWEEAWSPRPEPRWRLEEEGGAPAPVSLEYEGPEAYSLEDVDFQPVERSVPTPEARHRRFHEQIETTPRPERSHRSATGRALGSPDSLRRAFVLTEVLGTPKGLE